MNVNDIVTLARAGFTADQITRLYAAPAPAVAQPAAPAPVAAQPAAPASVVTAPPNIPNVPVETPASDTNSLAAIMREVSALRSAVQSGAILASSQPPAERVEDILASIINPGATK